MIHELSEHEYAATRMLRCVKRKEVEALTTPALLLIVHQRMALLSPPEVAVLLFLLAETLASGRVAREASIREISSGIKEDTGVSRGGTGLSENGIRSALRSLTSSGLVTVFREVKANGVDNSARLYEIDFNGLSPLLAQQLRSVVAEKHDTPTARDAVPPFTPCRALHISNSVTHSQQRATSSSTRVASSVGHATQPEIEEMAYVGKRPGTPSLRSQSTPTEAEMNIAAVVSKGRAKVQARVAATTGVAPHTIDRAGMQAVFDSASQGIGLPYRLMVTTKEFGFLRKRLKENPPQDIKDMVRYSLTYWGILSQQNRKAFTNSAGKSVIGRALPEAPHFSTFTYWYPYFFKAYQNHLAGKVIESKEGTADTVHKARADALQRQLIAAERANVVLRRRSPAPVEPMRPTTTKPRLLPAKVSDADLLAPVSFPEWGSTGGRA